MSLRSRLEKLERAAGQLPDRERFTTVVLCPLSAAFGRTPGMYRAGAPGSTSGIFVHPDGVEPDVPGRFRLDCTLVIGGDVRPWEDDFGEPVA